MARPDPPAAPSRQPSRTPLLATHVSGAGPLQGSDDSAAAAEVPLLLHDEPASSSPDSENGDDDTDAEARTAVLEANLTPLDAALEKIGMGRYQYQLLVLCGLGWAMDNMTLQTVSVILPRVQEHFQVGDRYIGLLSTSIFAGMMASRVFLSFVQVNRYAPNPLTVPVLTCRSEPGAGAAVRLQARNGRYFD